MGQQAKTIREAVAERGDDWKGALDTELRRVHDRNEFLTLVGRQSERSDYYRMYTIQNHRDATVRAFYRSEA